MTQAKMKVLILRIWEEGQGWTGIHSINEMGIWSVPTSLSFFHIIMESLTSDLTTSTDGAKLCSITDKLNDPVQVL